LAKETPSYSGASSSAAPWNSQPQQQRDHSSWAAAAVEQWTGSAATAAPSSPSTWWNQKKAPMEATLQTGFDPWTKSDPWQVSSTWASPSPEARALNSDQGQMDTQQSSTSMTQGRQLDTQQSQLPFVPAQRRTQFGVALPPVYNAFGGAAYQKQRPPPAIKPQWIEGPLYRKFGLEPALVRTPRCHRRGHKHPSDLRITMKNFRQSGARTRRQKDLLLRSNVRLTRSPELGKSRCQRKSGQSPGSSLTSGLVTGAWGT